MPLRSISSTVRLLGLLEAVPRPVPNVTVAANLQVLKLFSHLVNGVSQCVGLGNEAKVRIFNQVSQQIHWLVGLIERPAFQSNP